MSFWQAILIGGWLVAVSLGRADREQAVVVAANFAVTAIWPGSVGIVGLADLATIAALSGMGRRGEALAWLYIVAAVIRPMGAALGFDDATTYAILDPIGWAILAVLGNVDTGIGYLLRRSRDALGRYVRRLDRGRNSVAQRHNPGGSVAVVLGERLASERVAR